MSSVVEAMTDLLNFPETLEKLLHSTSRHDGGGGRGGVANFPADILDTPKEYAFYLDVPGLSKSDIQVTVEEENTLVIKSNGKRKREEGEEEGCKYIRLERRPPQKLTRKFRLPDNCNVSAISAKCENGVLTVVVKKLPPPPKSKLIEVAIS
ncbi:17.4 kDa class III heat shock protein-like [Salvia splendens]|uniref:17.4 kDa class III heat shock protein-like n=1 Tax=Salvia splendens TaxID=180675 RepID=UPI001C270951|nr:17.4 kDa class III heat shock protein-like [Salvia splendens]